MELLLYPAVFIAVVVGFVLWLFNKALVKASPGQALIKTGFGLTQSAISTSSAIVLPLLHKVDTVDLTVKTVKITRKGQHESLSCADGIRAEVEVDFYIQINVVEDDIRRVATTVGCARASNVETIRELFEAKFADALKTAGAKLTFDQLYQNRRLFRTEILKALTGETGVEHDVILNGYKLDDVAIQYLEQLPLDKHDKNNVLDSKGIKEIAQRTSSEAEAANKRLRQREVTIAEQDQEAKTRQLQISQDLAQKQAFQERTVRESQSEQKAIAEQKIAEQQRLEAQALIEKERLLKISEEKKQQDIQVAQKSKEEATLVAEEKKLQAVEIARINRETAQAEQLKGRLDMLEQVAVQESKKIKAEEQAQTVRAVEIANRQRQIEVIDAEKKAAVQVAIKNVEADTKAYELTRVAEAKLKSADLDAQAAAKQAAAIVEVGQAEARTLQLRLEAQNVIGDRALAASALNQIIPMLPTLVAQLMKPAEKIESIKVLNILGMNGAAHALNGVNGSNGSSNGASGSGDFGAGGSVINTVLGVGMALPLLREIMGTLRSEPSYGEVMKAIQEVPGSEAVMDYIENFGGGTNGGKTQKPVVKK